MSKWIFLLKRQEATDMSVSVSVLCTCAHGRCPMLADTQAWASFCVCFFFHCIPYQFTSPVHPISLYKKAEVLQVWSGHSRGPWDSLGRSMRWKLLNPKEFLAFQVNTVVLSIGLMACDITTDWESVFCLLYQTLMRFARLLSSLNLLHFRKHSYSSLKMLFTLICNGFISVF